ncbi:MAG: hypothetical protein ACI91B_004234, partial [Planctomycetota bacterium]
MGLLSVLSGKLCYWGFIATRCVAPSMAVKRIAR